MSPPEVVAAIFETGPGPASVLANQLVWIVETVNHELAIGRSAANTAATATEWIGLGGAASGRSAAGLNGGLQTLVGWITHRVAVTQAAVDAYLAAASAVIPSVVSQTNRDETAVLHATNFLGVNTPAIVERDTEYFGEHWPHNAGVGVSYASVLTGLTGALGVPPPAAPGMAAGAPGVAGSAAQTAAQAGAQTGAQDAMASSGQLGSVLPAGSQLASTMSEPVRSLAGAPSQALQGFSSAPQALMGAVAPMRSTAAPTFGIGSAGAFAEAMPGAAAGPPAGAGGYSGAGLTSYTRPAGTFTPERGGRPTGRAGVLNAAELRGPTSTARGGSPVPLAPAGMLGRPGASDGRDDVGRARVVVAESRRS